MAQAGVLLAAVVGQDLDEGCDGVFRIARRVAKDRIISTVEPDARHGHKTAARGFDGYKGQLASSRCRSMATSVYGAGSVLDTLEDADAEVMCKVQPPVAPGGRFAKDEFDIDLQAGTVTCPAGQTATLRAVNDGQLARFGLACHGCPLAARCTASTDGRTIHVGPHEAALTRARARQADPGWKADYTQTRPKVERKIAHLMRRRHGGRRARSPRLREPRKLGNHATTQHPATLAAATARDHTRATARRPAPATLIYTRLLGLVGRPGVHPVASKMTSASRTSEPSTIAAITPPLMPPLPAV